MLRVLFESSSHVWHKWRLFTSRSKRCIRLAEAHYFIHTHIFAFFLRSMSKDKAKKTEKRIKQKKLKGKQRGNLIKHLVLLLNNKRKITKGNCSSRRSNIAHQKEILIIYTNLGVKGTILFLHLTVNFTWMDMCVYVFNIFAHETINFVCQYHFSLSFFFFLPRKMGFVVMPLAWESTNWRNDTHWREAR